MVKVYLIVLILSGGAYTPDREDGWNPREQPNMEVCLKRAVAFNKNERKGGPRKAICREVKT